MTGDYYSPCDWSRQCLALVLCSDEKYDSCSFVIFYVLLPLSVRKGEDFGYV